MEQIVNPAGLRVLESLVALIRDVDAVENILVEMHKARDEANKRIAVAGWAVLLSSNSRTSLRRACAAGSPTS